MDKSEIKDALGDRLKAVESIEASRAACHDKPLMARLDGKAFSTFTRGLRRPYDIRMTDLMIATTKYLIENTHARLGYTQSDEISLCWWNDDLETESSYMFNGKYQKLTSVLAGMASAVFTKLLPTIIPEKSNKIAVFDCRVWNVENKHEVYLNYLWRQDDAIRNSISMAAQSHFSSKQLHGIDSETKKKMLREVGDPWESQPQFFKMGTYIQRLTEMTVLTPEQLLNIPEQYRPTEPILRSVVKDIGLGYIKGDPFEIFE